MKIKYLTVCLLVASTAFSEELDLKQAPLPELKYIPQETKTSYMYVDVGADLATVASAVFLFLPIPTFSVGYRSHEGHHGYDFGYGYIHKSLQELVLGNAKAIEIRRS